MAGARRHAFCLPANVQAQGQYAVDWFKIPGGGTSSNGQFTVSGTIGQPEASAAMAGGNYSLTGGFWSLIAVAQTAGAPTLFISQSGSAVTIYWQAVSGWSLQQNSNLASASGWTASSGVNSNNGTNSLTLVNPSGNLFFRLH